MNDAPRLNVVADQSCAAWPNADDSLRGLEYCRNPLSISRSRGPAMLELLSIGTPEARFQILLRAVQSVSDVSATAGGTANPRDRIGRAGADAG
jgi:hypothetical protein